LRYVLSGFVRSTLPTISKFAVWLDVLGQYQPGWSSVSQLAPRPVSCAAAGAASANTTMIAAASGQVRPARNM
jgi:hypothetical protein